MRVVRSAGQNVSPSDDGRLFDQIFNDGLFVDTTISALGTNNVSIGALYGVICGRDFTAEAQTVQVELPENDDGTTGYIYVEIDTSSDDVITIGSALAPFTPTYEDINTNGAVVQMIIAEYSATSVAVTTISSVYKLAVLSATLNAIVEQNAGARNSIFRGKSLGTSITADQWTAISSGKFTDLFVGDYWTLGSKVYRIAGFDIFLHRGDTELTAHHAVIVPDANMYSEKMNDSNTTSGGYYGSKMKTSGLATALSTVQSAFGAAHILSHKALLTNAVSGDAPSGWAWYSTQIDLMTEAQVYGQYNWGQHAQNGYESGIDYDRFPLFSLAPEFICNRANWWLRSVQSSTIFCLVYDDGYASYRSASYSYGVRPFFLIG